MINPLTNFKKMIINQVHLKELFSCQWIVMMIMIFKMKLTWLIGIQDLVHNLLGFSLS